MNYQTLYKSIELVCVCVCVCVCACMWAVSHYVVIVICHTQGSQGKVKESKRLKDNGRLDVSTTTFH